MQRYPGWSDLFYDADPFWTQGGGRGYDVFKHKQGKRSQSYIFIKISQPNYSVFSKSNLSFISLWYRVEVSDSCSDNGLSGRSGQTILLSLLSLSRLFFWLPRHETLIVWIFAGSGKSSEFVQPSQTPDDKHRRFSLIQRTSQPWTPDVPKRRELTFLGQWVDDLPGEMFSQSEEFSLSASVPGWENDVTAKQRS